MKLRTLNLFKAVVAINKYVKDNGCPTTFCHSHDVGKTLHSDEDCPFAKLLEATKAFNE